MSTFSTHHLASNYNNCSSPLTASNNKNKTCKKWKKASKALINSLISKCSWWLVKVSKLSTSPKGSGKRLICRKRKRFSRLIIMTQQEVIKRLTWYWEVWAFQPRSTLLRGCRLWMSLCCTRLRDLLKMASMVKLLTSSNSKANKSLVRNSVKLLRFF